MTVFNYFSSYYQALTCFNKIATTELSGQRYLAERRTPNAVFACGQEGGVNLLAQLWDCAANDLSHYDVTSEPVREILMAAKR